jgi:hypothetical protein
MDVTTSSSGAVAEMTDGSRNEEKAPDIRFVWTPSQM